MKEGWQFYRSAMTSILGCSRQKFNNVMNELLRAGLVEKGGQSAKGKRGFGAVQYVVHKYDHISNDHISNDHIKTDHLTILTNNNTKIEQEQSYSRRTREEILFSIFLSVEEDKAWRKRQCRDFNISDESLGKSIERAKDWMADFGKTLTKRAFQQIVRKQIKIDSPAPAGTVEERKRKLIEMIQADDATRKVARAVKNEFFKYYTQVDSDGWLRYERDPYFNSTEKLKKWILNGH